MRSLTNKDVKTVQSLNTSRKIMKAVGKLDRRQGQGSLNSGGVQTDVEELWNHGSTAGTGGATINPNKNDTWEGSVKVVDVQTDVVILLWN